MNDNAKTGVMAASLAVVGLIVLKKVFNFILHVRRLSSHTHTITHKSRTPLDPHRFPQFFIGKSGVFLYTREWTVPNPKAVVFISHGYGEHIGRYEHVARALNQDGFSVYGLDHQGHGLSEGDRAFMPVFQDTIDDFIAFAKRTDTGKLPRFLLGHSMGGLIATHIVRTDASLWTGLLVTCPLLAVDPKIASPTLLKIAKHLARVLPKFQLDPVPANGLSHDQSVVERYNDDPLVYHGGTLALTGVNFVNAINLSQETASSTTLPTLILHGAEDPICPIIGSEKYFMSLGSKDKTFKTLPGMFHEILNEVKSAEVIGTCIEWFNQHMPADV